MQPNFQTSSSQQYGISWLAEFSQVQDISVLLSPLVPILSIIGCHHTLKVLGNKVLPLVCLVAILAYWMLGIALPSTDSSILDDNASNCTLPE